MNRSVVNSSNESFKGDVTVVDDVNVIIMWSIVKPNFYLLRNFKFTCTSNLFIEVKLMEFNLTDMK